MSRGRTLTTMPRIVRVVRVVPARAGLVGNPSDGYGGAVIAVPVASLGATVSASVGGATPRGEVVLAGPLGRHTWPSIAAFVRCVDGEGHPESIRIVTAALRRCLEHLRARGASPSTTGGVEIRWSTTIPRSVGLAGSSALAVGVIDATSRAWGVELDPLAVAAVALEAEVAELGIAAGWQDRVVQAIGRPVLVDAGEMSVVDGLPVPSVRVLRPPVPLHVVVGWRSASATPSGDYHEVVRRRADDLGPVMDQLAAVARVAADAVDAGDESGLRDAVALTWGLRRAAVPLRDDHAALVDAARAAGATATTPGSGGSVVAVLGGNVATQRVLDALGRHGAEWCTGTIVAAARE